MTTLGILGGGQLAQMLALAARPLGVECVFVDPNAASPAAGVASAIVAAYDDASALRALAERVSVATYEFENVPDVAARELAERVPLLPPPEALRVAQDRLVEKETLREIGVPVPDFARVDDRATLAAAVARIGLPCVLKTRRFGYDGKGQTVVKSADDAELDRAWRDVGGGRVPCIVESFVRFDRELSQLAVRGRDGATRFYPLVESRHERGILRETLAPAAATPAVSDAARAHAAALMDRLGYVGVLALETFDVAGTLLANEYAPRVHNSGHWTIEGAVTSQFESHVRAVLGLPLGDVAAVAPRVAMLNVLGDAPAVRDVLAVPGAHLHLYGKSPAPGRKLGHVTLVDRGDGSFDASLAAVRALVDAKTVLA